jgi:hypothetical protein
LGTERWLSARAALSERVDQLLGRNGKIRRAEQIKQKRHIVIGELNRTVHVAPLSLSMEKEHRHARPTGKVYVVGSESPN